MRHVWATVSNLPTTAAPTALYTQAHPALLSGSALSQFPGEESWPLTPKIVALVEAEAGAMLHSTAQHSMCCMLQM